MRLLGPKHVQLGTQLSAAFVEAGLPFPQMRLGSLVGTGPDWAGYDLLAETLCIILPRLVEYGIVQAGEVDIDTWSEQRLFIASGILMGAWTRVDQAVDIRWQPITRRDLEQLSLAWPGAYQGVPTTSYEKS